MPINDANGRAVLLVSDRIRAGPSQGPSRRRSRALLRVLSGDNRPSATDSRPAAGRVRARSAARTRSAARARSIRCAAAGTRLKELDRAGNRACSGTRCCVGATRSDCRLRTLDRAIWVDRAQTGSSSSVSTAGV